MNILFCNVIWMKEYKRINNDDIPRVDSKHYDWSFDEIIEKNNFLINNDGMVRGYVEIGSQYGWKNSEPKNIRIERICKTSISSNFVDGVDVVFCAKKLTDNKLYIVGFYRNARIYRRRNKISKDSYYNIECRAEDAYLIKENKRTFVMPRAAKDGVGMGQSNIWYADTIKANDLKAEVFEYINKISKT